HEDVDDSIRHLHRDRADLLWRVNAQPAALDHRRSAHADGRGFGRDDDVGTGDQRRIAGEAATVNHRNHRHQARQLRKGGECPGVDCYPRTSMIVAGPATSSLAKEYKRQTEAVTELEDAIL